MTKAVLFDVDGVLIDSLEANFGFFKNLITHVGYAPPSRAAYPGFFHLTMKQAIAKMVPEADETEVDRIWQIAVDKKDDFYPQELLTAPKKLQQVIETLNQNYKLGIVTSRIRGGVFYLSVLAPLEKFFATAVYFEDTAKHKPEPEPLLLACERLSVSPSQSVYIGDTQTDILAANSAGVKAIAFSKEQLIGADLQTADFEELPKLVKLLG